MKKLTSSQDLAINGAPPAFQEPLHVGRPNIGSYELFAKYTKEIFHRKWLTNNGPLVQEFEHKIENYLGVKHCIAMCNGTVALEIAIRALGMKGEVIIPSFTFIATAHALSWQAITPVFADINPTTHTIDPDSVRQMITPKTTGIIGVHLWGNSCAIEELEKIAHDHNLKLMFDGAHAFSCTHQGQMIGSFGECEVLSFHATKFFNTFEGGAVVTNNKDLADEIRLMRNFGFSGMDNVIYSGTNGKMIEVAAAMGLVNLENLDKVLQHNRKNYHYYSKALSDQKNINLLQFNKDEQCNYQYVVLELHENSPVTRDQIIKTLHKENIRARRYFWPGCHNMKPYKELYPHAELMLPNTVLVANRVIVLPTGINITNKMIRAIASIIHISLKE